MKFLYSNILPLGLEDGQQTIADCIREQMSKATRVEIAVGYVSRNSMVELEKLVSVNKISKICLNMGMYYSEGIPENFYNTAIRINEKWVNQNIGEIRVVRSFKYHGKVYCFYKDEKPFAAVIGSANLGVMQLEASNLRQYELSVLTTDNAECLEIATFLEKLKLPKISARIDDVTDMQLLYEKNMALSNIENVSEVPPSNVAFYQKCTPRVDFLLPLKVPSYDERHIDDGKHFTKSNINVCYAAPRSKHKSRDWFETQLTVSKEITKIDGYPEKNVPFYIVTDDGYWFKAHTTSDGNKQFSAVGDELIMGRWLKGRLVAAGLIEPVNNTQIDTERKGMITKEILDEYGCDNLYFKKTGQTAIDENGEELDIWLLSFKPGSMKKVSK